MPIYNAPIRDMQFIIHEMLNAKQLGGYDKFSDVDTDLIDAILEESGKFATDVLTPLNAVGDHEGCTRSQRRQALKTLSNKWPKTAGPR